LEHKPLSQSLRPSNIVRVNHHTSKALFVLEPILYHYFVFKRHLSGGRRK